MSPPWGGAASGRRRPAGSSSRCRRRCRAWWPARWDRRPAGDGVAAVVDPLGPFDDEAVAAQHGRHFGVPVLVLVVGVDEGVLLQAGQVGVGRVEREDPARLEHASGLGQHLFGLGARDVLDALAAVDHVEGRRRVAAEVGHGVVAVGDPAAGDVDRRLRLAVLVELVAVLARQVDDDDLLERVRVSHQDERAVGDAERDAADVEDPACPRQAADEDAAPVVQGGPELGHGRRMAPFRRVDQPLHQLARALRAVLELGHERVVGSRVPAEEEVEEPPVQLAGRQILEEARVGERVGERGRPCSPAASANGRTWTRPACRRL